MSRSVGQFIAQLRHATADQVAEINALLGRAAAEEPRKSPPPPPPTSPPPAPAAPPAAPLREIPLEPLAPRQPAPAATQPAPAPAPPAPASRGYWDLVVAATRKREADRADVHDPFTTHWMLCVLAAADLGYIVPAEAPAPEQVAAMERLHADDPAWALQKLKRFVRGELTPRPIRSTMAHEEAADPKLLDVQLALFLRRETEEAGRGTVAGALRHLLRAAREEHLSPEFDGLDPEEVGAATLALKFSRLWPNPEGRDWVVANLRPYLVANRCTLPPLGSAPAAGAGR